MVNEDFMCTTYGDSQIEFLNKLVRKYRRKRLSFRGFIKEARGAAFTCDVLLSDVEIFRKREKLAVLSRAVLDGGDNCVPSIIKKYLEVGLSKRVLINWLKRNLQKDFFVSVATEMEDWICDFVVLDLCKILKQYNISTKQIKAVLDSLPKGVKAFYYMIYQQDEWRKIGIDPEEYRGRCFEYIENRCAKGENFNAEIILDLKVAPKPISTQAIKMIVFSESITTQEIIKAFKSPSDAVEFLQGCGIKKSKLAKILVRDFGSAYETYPEKEITYATLLLPEARKILNSKEVNRVYEERHPSCHWLAYEFEDDDGFGDCY